MSTVVWSKTAGHNLRRHKALPDQLVDLKFIFFQITVLPGRDAASPRWAGWLRARLVLPSSPYMYSEFPAGRPGRIPCQRIRELPESLRGATRVESVRM